MPRSDGNIGAVMLGDTKLADIRSPWKDERCDFCCGPEPTLVYAIGLIELRRGNGSLLLRSDEGQWACCPNCAGLFEVGDVEALTGRFVKQIQAWRGGGPSMSAVTVNMALYAEAVRRRAIGPPCPIELAG
jgi:hypothetical protein